MALKKIVFKNQKKKDNGPSPQSCDEFLLINCIGREKKFRKAIYRCLHSVFNLPASTLYHNPKIINSK